MAVIEVVCEVVCFRCGARLYLALEGSPNMKWCHRGTAQWECGPGDQQRESRRRGLLSIPIWVTTFSLDGVF